MLLACGTATAEPANNADPDKSDPLAREAAEEANLESNAPRAGLTLSAAVGGSLVVGSDGGVGKGGALSLRLGHVATPHTVITFEIVGGSYFHSVTSGATKRNDDVNVLAGAQWYTTPGLFLRAAGGFGTYTKVDASLTTNYPGPAGLVGFGYDLFRRHYLVLGVEGFGIGKIARDGIHTFFGFCFGLSYY